MSSDKIPQIEQFSIVMVRFGKIFFFRKQHDGNLMCIMYNTFQHFVLKEL